MKYIVVIPARYKSTRLPGKPLISINGKSMIRRVYEQCIQVVDPSLVYVATDHDLIINECNTYGINVIKTSEDCLTGTDRIKEVANIIDADVYINVQGDEPIFNPNDLNILINNLPKYPGIVLNGFAKTNISDKNNINIPKVVFNKNKELLYMSRAAIPGSKLINDCAYKQVCLYSFPRDILMEFDNKKTFFESYEDIEILRFLENGYKVQLLEMSGIGIAVDTPEDIKRVESYLNNK